MKAIIDDDGHIVGVAETAELARRNAVEAIMAHPRDYVEGLVEFFSEYNMTEALLAEVNVRGADVPYGLVSPSKLGTPAEARAARIAAAEAIQREDARYMVRCGCCRKLFRSDDKRDPACVDCIKSSS